MPARKQLWHPAHIREKIAVSRIVQEFQKHIFWDWALLAQLIKDDPAKAKQYMKQGGPMSRSQIMAGCKLLDKCVPDLAAIKLEGTGENGELQTQNVVVVKQFVEGFKAREEAEEDKGLGGEL